MENNNFKDVIISLMVNILTYILFYANVGKMNVFILLGFTILPIILSVMISTIKNKRNVAEKKNRIIKSGIYTIGNGLYLVGQKLLFNIDPKYVEKILSSTVIGPSEYVNIKVEGSSVLSLIVLIVVSFSFHYISLYSFHKGKDI